MKIECVKEKLKDAISVSEKVTGKNISLPILNNLLFIAYDNYLKIRATNLDLGIEIKISAKIHTEGIVAIPGFVIGTLISNTYEKNIELTLVDGNLLVSTDRSKTTIKSYPYEDFPTLPHIENKNPFTINAQKLVSGLKSVVYSASSSDIKPEISSVYLYTQNGHIFFVATDSFRLAERKIAVSYKNDIPPVIIPLKNIIEIIRILDTVSDDIHIHFDKNQISFSAENLYITSRLIEGVFPDYTQIIPKNFTTEAVVLKQDLMNALKISNVFSDKMNQVNFIVDPKKKIFEIKSKNFDVGEHVTRVDAAFSGEPIDLNFNYRYILDCFPSIVKDSITLYLNGESRPLLIRAVSDNLFTYLVMPLNK